MINVLVVEDEVAAANRLVKMIREIDRTIDIVKVTDSVESTVKWFKENLHPDLMFLDIHLADDSSFKIFRQISVQCPVIFTTAYDQYAIQAFKVNSIDYLLKPIKRNELAFSLDKYRKSKQSAIDIASLMEEVKKQQMPKWQQRFVVQYADKIKSIDVDEVAYFYAQEKSVFIASRQGTCYAIDYTLEKLESVIDPEKFFRINRKFIVSIGGIGHMHLYSKSRVKLELFPKPFVDAIVSSERAMEFKEWLNR